MKIAHPERYCPFIFMNNGKNSRMYAKQEIMNITEKLDRILPKNKEIIIIAIGSDRVTGDCLGPLVGEFLKETGVWAYGNLTSPITALCVEEIWEMVRQRHPNAFFLAIDSAVGESQDVGKIKVIPKGLRPALGVGKNLPTVGHASVIGVVAPFSEGGKSLESIRLGNVFRMAKRIAKATAQTVASRNYKFFNADRNACISSSEPIVIRK